MSGATYVYCEQCQEHIALNEDGDIGTPCAWAYCPIMDSALPEGDVKELNFHEDVEREYAPDFFVEDEGC